MAALPRAMTWAGDSDRASVAFDDLLTSEFEPPSSELRLRPIPRHPLPETLCGEASVATGRFVFFKRAKTRVAIELDGTRLVAQDQDKNVVWAEDLTEADVSPMKRTSSIIVKRSGSSKRRIDITPKDYKTWMASVDQAAAYSLANFYSLGHKIGEGRFATVHEGTCLASNETVAIKRILKSNDEQSRVQSVMLARERSVVSKVAHPCIVELLDLFDQDDALYFVMEYMRGGSAADKLIELRKFSESDTRETMRSVLSGLRILHAQKYIHRDIKPENILIKSSLPGPVKISDFGLSCALNGNGKSVDGSCVGSPSYRAPEMIKKTRYDCKVDIWACGVAMHAMLTGRLPFVHHDPKSLQAAIKKGTVDYNTREWKDISKLARETVQALLVVDPAGRPSAALALKSPFFEATK